jgi:hypothetical protein
MSASLITLDGLTRQASRLGSLAANRNSSIMGARLEPWRRILSQLSDAFLRLGFEQFSTVVKPRHR